MRSALVLPSWAVVTLDRRAHITRVTALIDRWASEMNVGETEASRWQRAAVFHDALKDAPPQTLERYLPRGDWAPQLWHGPAAAVAAQRHGERDAGVLDAVRYHSVGFAGWDDAGKVLYLADYLEPGRDHDPEGCAALSARVPRELGAVLRDVAKERIAHLESKGTIIRQETRDFWTRLTAAGS